MVDLLWMRGGPLPRPLRHHRLANALWRRLRPQSLLPRFAQYRHHVPRGPKRRFLESYKILLFRKARGVGEGRSRDGYIIGRQGHDGLGGRSRASAPRAHLQAE